MPHLPNIAAAYVEDAKLGDYLLNTTHPRGGPKARFLLRFGFVVERPDALRQALIAHAVANEISRSRTEYFGVIFEIEGPLSTPDGRDPYVRTVWMLDTGAAAPRLITLVPTRAVSTTRSAS